MVRHEGFELVTFRGGYFDDYPGAHRTDLHTESPRGNAPADSTVAFNPLDG